MAHSVLCCFPLSPQAHSPHRTTHTHIAYRAATSVAAVARPPNDPPGDLPHTLDLRNLSAANWGTIPMNDLPFLTVARMTIF